MVQPLRGHHVPHISIIGHITADELNRYWTQTETANGSGNRFLWLSAKRSKLLPFGGHARGDELDELNETLARALT